MDANGYEGNGKHGDDSPLFNSPFLPPPVPPSSAQASPTGGLPWQQETFNASPVSTWPAAGIRSPCREIENTEPTITPSIDIRAAIEECKAAQNEASNSDDEDSRDEDLEPAAKKLRIDSSEDDTKEETVTSSEEKENENEVEIEAESSESSSSQKSEEEEDNEAEAEEVSESVREITEEEQEEEVSNSEEEVQHSEMTEEEEQVKPSGESEWVLLTYWWVTPCGVVDLGQHWFRCWLVAWRHQAITWTNLDLSSIKTLRNLVKWNFHFQNMIISSKENAFASVVYKMSVILFRCQHIEAETNGQHFADDTFKRIFSNENVRISIKISLKFVPKGPINNIPALVQIMAWPAPSHYIWTNDG